MTDERSLNIKALFIPRGDIVGLLTNQIKISDIPMDAEIFSVREDFMRNGLMMVMRHSSFPPIKEGEAMEIINCTFEMI